MENYSIIDLGKTAFKWDREKRKLVPKTPAEKEADYNKFEEEEKESTESPRL